MRFKADEIASVLRQEIEQYESRIDVREVGRVLEVGDGIARIYGLSGVMAGEMVQFPHDVFGLALNLEENSVGVIILGDYLSVQEGDEVRSTGRLLSVAVGAELMCRLALVAPGATHKAGFHPTAVMGTLAAAAGVAGSMPPAIRRPRMVSRLREPM